MQQKKGIVFNQDMDELLTGLYPVMHNKELAEIFGCHYRSIEYHAIKRLKLKKSEWCRRDQVNVTRWTPKMVRFIKRNFFKMTNQQMADALGLRLTVLRNKTKLLGLKNYDLQYWTAEQAQFLRDHWQTMGDTVIAEGLQQRWPRNKVWTRKHVKKKRDYLLLFRTPDQVSKIVATYSVPGGRSDTIAQNSASTNLPDRYVANFISRDPEVKDELVKLPVILDLKRADILLKRKIKEVQHGTL